MQLSEALDRAKATSGSDSATGRALGMTPAQIHDARVGRKPFPREKRRALCDLADLTEEEAQSLYAAFAGYEPRKPRSPSTTGTAVLTGIGALAAAVAAGAALSGHGEALSLAVSGLVGLYIM